MNRFFHSVRWRLQLWHALILAIVIVVLCALAHRLVSNDRTDRIDRDLRSVDRTFFHHLREKFPEGDENNPTLSTDGIRNALKSLTDTPDLPHNLRPLFDPAATDSTYIVYWDSDDSILFHSANAPQSLQPPVKDEKRTGTPPRNRPPYREILRGSPSGLRSIVGRDVSAEHTSLRNLTLSIALSGVGLWALGLFGGWWLAGRAIRPIKSISNTASRIAGGELSERIDIADTDDELGQLSHTLNDTFDRLEAALRRQQEFTADASHELRTPLTIILSETARGLKRDRTPEEYRDLLQICQLAGTRMKGLVEALLVLARHDSPTTKTVFEPTDLATLASETTKLLKNFAETHSITLETDFQPAPCQGDPTALNMAISNLLTNAIQHQPPGGHVTLRTHSENGKAIFQISNTGPGIPAEHLPRLFDRFYQIDTSRTAGHSGLGLAIVKAITDTHQGTITAQSTPTLTTFHLSLPQNPSIL